MAPKGAFPDDAAIAFYLALALLMLFARGLGELARMFKQPAVLGEVSRSLTARSAPANAIIT